MIHHTRRSGVPIEDVEFASKTWTEQEDAQLRR